ncbi:hypothetical protein FEK43_06870, partial [Escherichia sp. E2562]
ARHQIKRKAIRQDGLFALMQKKKPDAALVRLIRPPQGYGRGQQRIIPSHTPDSATDTVSPNRPPQSAL